MARKKKNDFWDDVEEVEASETQSEDDSTASTAADEEWSAVKSLPLKVIMRFLLMISCLVAMVSAYVAYAYVDDRMRAAATAQISLTAKFCRRI